MKTTILAVAAILLPMAAAAHDAVAAEDVYARSTNPKSGAVYMMLDNHRAVDCTLSGVTSDVADRLELHGQTQVNGMASMPSLDDGIAIPAGQRHMLERGGDHVMMMGIKIPLKNGDSFAMTLDFGDCGTVDVDVPVDNDRTPEDAAMDSDTPGTTADEHAGH